MTSARSSLPFGIILWMLTQFHAGEASGADLVGFDGQPRELGQFTGQGKWTVLMFWASDCHVCNEEAPRLAAFHERHADRDAIMLGLSLDGWAGRSAANAFILEHEIPYENLLTEPVDGASLYRELTGRSWVGTPTFVVYAPDGTVVAQQVGAIEPEVIEDFMARHATGSTD